MKKKNILTDENSHLEYEIAIIKDESRELQEKINRKQQERELSKEAHRRLRKGIADYFNITVDDLTKEHYQKISCLEFDKICDSVIDIPSNLITISRKSRPYSLLKDSPELEREIPHQNYTSALQLLNNRSSCQANEIIIECTAENTRLAYKSDIVYWEGWLSAIGFDAYSPISENEIVSFIMQHVEGLDRHIDEKLCKQGFKNKLGPHRLATVKRRVATLSAYLSHKKLSNPCRNKEIFMLLHRLTKKYGTSKPSGKAITKDILEDMLATCNDKLIDIRDKAILLFAWGSGGRRRSEVTAADMKNLTTLPDGGFVYNLPESKTDQEAKGHPVPLKGRVAQAVDHWLRESKITEGPIFRAISKGGEIRKALSPIDIYRIVKRRTKKAGYDESQYCAHSLRSGFVTEAGRKNKSLGDVMALTTHKNVGTVMKYYQAGNIINNSAANLAD